VLWQVGDVCSLVHVSSCKIIDLVFLEMFRSAAAGTPSRCQLADSSWCELGRQRKADELPSASQMVDLKGTQHQDVRHDLCIRRSERCLSEGLEIA